MKNNLQKTLDLFQFETDRTFLYSAIESFSLREKTCYFLFDLQSDRCFYFCPAISGMIGFDHRKFLNKGFLFFKTIIHPHDFSFFIDEVLTLVKLADMCNEGIFPGNKSGLSIRIKKRDGEWFKTKIFLIYLKGAGSNISKILLGFIEKDDFNQESETILTAKITFREKEIFRFLSVGNSAKMIADKLGISENTVITHRKNLIYKLKVKNSAELIKKGLELNILNSSSFFY